MRIRSIAFTASNLSLCEPLRGDRCTYSREAFPPVEASAARLLGQGRALGAIVFGGPHTGGVGLSTFAAEPFMDDFLAAPHPQIGRRLLQDEIGRAHV